MLITNLVKKLFGSRNERSLKRYYKSVQQINALEPNMVMLSDVDLAAKTQAFKDRLQAGATLEDILPEAFAVVREASKRTLGMRPFDVQLVGGMILHEGKIPEMRTGEGKTLVATLPLYLNALLGKGVHLVTVNDYLVIRDAEWNKPLYEFLGMTVGTVVHGMSTEEKQAAYAADITYGTNNEFGFDYLRDNMAFSPEQRVQRALYFAVVDEVDSILIDEARTPLVISGADQDSSDLYVVINKIIPSLSRQLEKEGPGDYSVDEKAKQVFLTEEGHLKVEKILVEKGLLPEGDSLYAVNHIALMHYIYAGLKAHALFKRDVDYIVRDNQVIIVDEHTGRTMQGRRWSDGIHQATEAKEGVPIQNENQTLASITFQNYFRLYDKLAGMTGTADTEAYEFQQIYGLEVIVVPTHRSNQRQDLGDMIYLSQKEKFDAIIEDIDACVKRAQPVLVGTISIETSEYLSSLLKQKRIKHAVLNAKYHESEAEIVAEAGRPGTVTIATNMAGRGTDIVLGGKLDREATEADKAQWQERHDQVLAAGGLHIIGTERHESRRIDNQLRGRSGRQGDPGSTRFYLSVKDNLMRIFISDNISGLLSKLGLKDGEALTHPWVTRAVENAQRKVEGHNFDIRKQLLEFDDVANDQRKVIYQQRNELMEAEDISETIKAIINDVAQEVITQYIPLQSIEEQWDIKGLMQALELDFGLKLDIAGWLAENADLHEDLLRERIIEAFIKAHEAKEQEIGAAPMRHMEKTMLLNVLDSQWKEHLSTMDYMRQSIHLRGYAQKDPKQEYKREAFALFTAMLERIKHETIALITKVHFRSESEIEAFDQERFMQSGQHLEFKHDSAPTFGANEEGEILEGQFSIQQPQTRDTAKIGRNEACPCGSGTKYKHCHGQLV